MTDSLPRIAIVGGTGPLGRGLARRFAAGGVEVVLGSRTIERAQRSAAELGEGITPASNAECARSAGMVILAVPWEGHADTVSALAPELAGKILVDCVNPLGFDAQGPFLVAVEEGSAAQQAQALAPAATVVAAFHHVSAVTLLDPGASVDADVLVVGDDRAATDLVQALASSIEGCRGLYAGSLRNAAGLEALTANLLALNRRYRSHAGVRITDV